VNQTDYSFPKSEKLKGSDEIREVFNRKKGVSCPGARLLTRRNGLEHNRIAFTFPRKFGNAVERNHSRRLSREAYRLLRNELRKGFDMVLLVYPKRPDEARKKPDGFKTRMDQLRDLFSRAGLFSNRE
jgi:ribonuclease P protein component